MISSFHITSFRGIKKLSLEFGQKNHIIGSNGSGKTHILDAIHILSGSEPLYGAGTQGEVGSEFEAIFTHNTLSRSYRRVYNDTREFFMVQGVKTTKPKYLKELPWRTVHISPFDMNLLYFAPSMRREYIDLILAKTYEQFPKVKKNYELVMRQRNALLKKVRDQEAMRSDLDFWDTKFAESAEIYLAYRKKYIHYVQEHIQSFPAFFSRYALTLSYEESTQKISENADSITESIQEYLQKNRERDIITGHTHIGPHRDDWGFEVSDQGNLHKAETYLSRGEMKMILLGLKMIEQDFMTKTLDIPIVLLIDDIFAELDEKNSEIFLNSLTPYQVILTSQKPLPNAEKYSDFICINLKND